MTNTERLELRKLIAAANALLEKVAMDKRMEESIKMLKAQQKAILRKERASRERV